jgi:hypothetical protein
MITRRHALAAWLGGSTPAITDLIAGKWISARLHWSNVVLS